MERKGILKDKEKQPFREGKSVKQVHGNDIKNGNARSDCSGISATISNIIQKLTGRI